MKKVIALLLVMALSCVLFASCGGSGGESKASDDPKEAIVGTWEYESGGYTYVFKADGTGEYSGMAFTYTIDGSKLSILYTGNTAPFETEFSIEGDKLNIKDSSGSDTIYVRK